MVRSLYFLSLLGISISVASACGDDSDCGYRGVCIHRNCATAACLYNEDCEAGTVCVGKECKPRIYEDEGKKCGDGVHQCWADLWCDYNESVCKRYLEVGERCRRTDADRCTAGSFCFHNLCRESSGSEGDICASDADCSQSSSGSGILGFLGVSPDDEPIVCRYVEFTELTESFAEDNYRTCQPRVPSRFGEDCKDTSDCRLDLQCRFGVCLPPSIEDENAPDGFFCQADDDCCSRKCETTRIDQGGGWPFFTPGPNNVQTMIFRYCEHTPESDKRC